MTFESPVLMKRGAGFYYLKPVNPGDCALFDEMLGKGKAGERTVFQGSFGLEEHTRTYDQLKTAWKLISIIFESIEGRRGSTQELYGLYLDLLNEYAVKVVCKLRGDVRPVHLNKDDPECSISTAAHFIEGLMIHLSQFCDLPMGPQTQVRGLLTTWLAWRGGLEDDPLDADMSEADWRLRHVFSEASGLGGLIQRAHIVSRGTDEKDIEEPWNWMALTVDEHRLQHSAGWEAFIAKYPHLTGRVERARRKAHKLGLV